MWNSLSLVRLSKSFFVTSQILFQHRWGPKPIKCNGFLHLSHISGLIKFIFLHDIPISSLAGPFFIFGLSRFVCQWWFLISKRHKCIVIMDSKHVSVFLGSSCCHSLSTAKAKELTPALCTDTYVSCWAVTTCFFFSVNGVKSDPLNVDHIRLWPL